MLSLIDLNKRTRLHIGFNARAHALCSSAARLLFAVALFPGVLIPHTGCGSGAPPANGPAKNAAPPPIDPAVLRADVERQAEWTPLRKAACPRQLPDRHEALRRYPALGLLDGLGLITITDGTAYGMYVKNMEITDAGRRALGGHLEETAEKYIITIARRVYLSGTEQFETPSGPDRLVAYFKWRWTPLNILGERLTLVPPSNLRGEYGGFATYTRAAGGGWTLDKVFLNSEDRDYMHPM